MAEYENASKRRRLDEAEGDDRINQNKLNVVNNAEQSVEILSIRANKNQEDHQTVSFSRSGETENNTAIKQSEDLTEADHHFHDKDGNTHAGLTEEMSLVQLNDDCLITIFRMLSLDDLNTISDTCSRFRAIAPSVFAIEHRTINLNAIFEANKCIKICDFRKVLMKLGSMISLKTNLTFEMSDDDPSTILNLISEYCSGSLKSLSFCDVNFTASMIPSMRLLCDSLESLRVSDCSIEDSIVADLFSRLNNLTTLELGGSVISEHLIKLHYPNLTSLYLNIFLVPPQNEYLDKCQLLKSFFQNHQIQKLEISCIQVSRYNSPSAFSDLCIDHLKTLMVNFAEDFDIVAIKNWFTNLESLILNDGSLDIPVQSLFSECRNVVNLEILGCVGIHSSIAPNDFPNLEYLKFDEIYKHQHSVFRQFLMNKSKLKSIIANNIEWATDTIEHLIKVEKIMLTYARGRQPKTWLNPLKKLKSIKKINLKCETNQEEAIIFFNEILNGSMESLTHLEFTGINNDIISAIAKFRNVRCLQLSTDNYTDIPIDVNLEPLGKLCKLSVFKLEGHVNISVDDLIGFVTGADKLTTLKLTVMNFKPVSESYEKITEIVHKRNQTLVISITDGHSDFVCESHEDLYIDRDVLCF